MPQNKSAMEADCIDQMTTAVDQVTRRQRVCGVGRGRCCHMAVSHVLHAAHVATGANSCGGL